MGYGTQWDIPYPIPATTPESVKFNHGNHKWFPARRASVILLKTDEQNPADPNFIQEGSICTVITV